MAIDEAMLLACHARLERPLHNVLYRRLWDTHECQDVVQDAFLALWDRRRRIDAASLDALAWTTALNLAKNRLRWRGVRRLVALEDAHEHADPSLSPEQLAGQRRVRAALERLDARQRDVLLLSEIAGLATSEIAAVLGIAPGTVGSRKHAAVVAMRALLGEGDE
jgi:RNA polymerase sigma-70 factor (ECF subfamily)